MATTISDDNSDQTASAEQIDLEAQAALACNRPDLCLGLIEIAQAMGIRVLSS